MVENQLFFMLLFFLFLGIGWKALSAINESILMIGGKLDDILKILDRDR